MAKLTADQQTAGDHKGDHVGHAGHQMLVDAGAGSGLLRLGLLDLVFVARAAGLRSLAPGLVDGGPHQRRAVVNRRLGAGFVDALAGEPGFIDLGVGGDDDRVGGGDGVIG